MTHTNLSSGNLAPVKIAFIGAGNMATSIIGGLIQNGWPVDNITATARTEETLSGIRNQFGIKTTTDNEQAVNTADIVMLCVKPHMIKDVLKGMSVALKSRKPLLISVAAGITMKSLESWSPKNIAIVRSMPNTPSLLRYGACGLFANDSINEHQKSLTDTIFGAVGIAEWVETEDMIDAIIAISGSGPAYYFLFMEAMKTVGVELGFSPEMSERLTLQTAMGAAQMAVHSDVDVAELRRRVCSPNGTTEQAIKTFQEGGLETLVDNAMKSAVKRAKEMALELAD